MSEHTRRRSASTWLLRGLASLAVIGMSVSLVAARGLPGNVFGTRVPVSAESEPVATEPHVVCTGLIDVEGGVISLAAAEPGRIAAMLVRENEVIEAGTELVHIDDRRAKLAVRQAEAALQSARNQLDEARKGPARHEHRLAQQRAAIEAMERRIVAARQVMTQKQNLHKEEKLSAEEFRASVEQVHELYALLRGEQAKLRELESHDPVAGVHESESVVAARETQLELARAALEDCTLRAPVAGTVLRVLASVGELAGAAKPLVMVAPSGPRLVRAEVDQEFAARVVVGQVATVRDDSTLGGGWRGRVQRISGWFAQRRQVMPDPSQFNDVRTVECIIELDAEGEAPRIGQRVRVTIEPGSSGQSVSGR